MINPIYIQRINLAVDYININLHKKLSLEQIAEQASFSKYHFHRVFKVVVGETLNNYIKRLKLEKAYKQLQISKLAVIDIAFELGYQSEANFSRDFKNFFGKTPSQIRSVESKTKRTIVKEFINTNITFKEVKFIPDKKVLYKRVHNGYKPEIINSAFLDLYNFATKNNLINNYTQSIGIGYDDPDYTPADKCRYDAGILLSKDVDIQLEAPFGITNMEAGNYAIFFFKGKAIEFKNAWDTIFKKWLIESNYFPENKPHFEMYLPSDAHENGIFKANLCLPVYK